MQIRRVMIITLVLALARCSPAAEPRWGCDLSFVPKLEHHGVVYSRAGYERTALEHFRSAGIDVLRVRLWHTPTEAWSGLDSVIALAERAHELGFEILLDIHYSDSWADPAQQTLPAAWQSLSFAQLEDSVYDYTNRVLRRFRDANVLPKAVQIGNEIGGGFLWNWGRVGGVYDTPQQWQQLTDLLKAGVYGVRDSLPTPVWPKIVIHHQEGGNNGACEWFFDHLIDEDVPFDIIGLSYYPWWHGSLDGLIDNVTQLSSRYDRDVQILETAYPYMTEWCDDEGNLVGEDTPLLPAFPPTPLGQAFYLGNLRDRLAAVPGLVDPLICLWEPAWIPTETFPSPWENLALFDCSGIAQPAFDVFPGLAPTGLIITRVGENVHLQWKDDASLFYRVFATELSDETTPVLLGSTTENEWVLGDEVLVHENRRYYVVGSAGP